MDIIPAVLASLVAFVVTFLSIPSIIKVAEEKHLYDEPDGARKMHKPNIPTLGGIGIFGGVVIALTLFVDFHTFPKIAYALSALVLLFFTGVKDDIIPLSPSKKILAQMIAAAILVLKCDVRLHYLYGFLWLDAIPYELSVVVSLFTILVIVNAFNLIDGINGLAGGVGVIVCLVFAYLFWRLNQAAYMVIALSLAGALLGFLYYNFAIHARIFMGDTGSLLIGLFSAWFSIEFIELNRVSEQLFKPTFAPMFAVAILFIPLFDTLRVFVLRISAGKSPFMGDRNHLHHLLVDSGLHHWQASLVLYVVNVMVVLFSLLFQDVSQTYALVFLLFSGYGGSYLLVRIRNHYRKITNGATASMNPVSAYKRSFSQRM